MSGLTRQQIAERASRATSIIISKAIRDASADLRRGRDRCSGAVADALIGLAEGVEEKTEVTAREIGLALLSVDRGDGLVSGRLQ